MLISDDEWFERQRIRPTTPGERKAQRHLHRFAWVTKGAAGGLTIEYGEL